MVYIRCRILIWLRNDRVNSWSLLTGLDPRDRNLAATASNKQKGIFYMHFPKDRTAHTMTFDEPVVEHWLEWKIAQTADGSTKKDRSDDRPLQTRVRYCHL